MSDVEMYIFQEDVDVMKKSRPELEEVTSAPERRYFIFLLLPYSHKHYELNRKPITEMNPQ